MMRNIRVFQLPLDQLQTKHFGSIQQEGKFGLLQQLPMEKVYVGSFDHKIYALNSSTGDEIWTFNTAGEVYSSPAVFNGVVYVGSFDHLIYALNASTGIQLWNFTTGGAIFSSPTVADGTLFFGSDDSYSIRFKCSLRPASLEL